MVLGVETLLEAASDNGPAIEDLEPAFESLRGRGPHHHVMRPIEQQPLRIARFRFAQFQPFVGATTETRVNGGILIRPSVSDGGHLRVGALHARHGLRHPQLHSPRDAVQDHMVDVDIRWVRRGLLRLPRKQRRHRSVCGRVVNHAIHCFFWCWQRRVGRSARQLLAPTPEYLTPEVIAGIREHVHDDPGAVVLLRRLGYSFKDGVDLLLP
mmetsp:Transcript_80372/g.223751  ORF Transcript_80372/g.223751 Transcript_80372/m.223751 type:complete len:211 (-) Transcript_80372:504-1136(-)